MKCSCCFLQLLSLLILVVFSFLLKKPFLEQEQEDKEMAKVNENTSSVNFVLKFHLITNILKIEAIGHFSCSFVRRQNQRSKDMKCKCTHVVYRVNEEPKKGFLF